MTRRQADWRRCDDPRIRGAGRVLVGRAGDERDCCAALALGVEGGDLMQVAVEAAVRRSAVMVLPVEVACRWVGRG